MKKEWFRRGGLIDYERLDRRARVLLILAFAILQPFVLLPVCVIILFLISIFIPILIPGINPLTFMLLTHEARVMTVNVMAVFVLLSAFCLTSLPIAYAMRMPVIAVVFFAVFSVPFTFLLFWISAVIF